VTYTIEEIRNACNIATSGRLCPKRLERLVEKVVESYRNQGDIVTEEGEA